MPKTLGALNKPKFIEVTLENLNKRLGAKSSVFISLEHHASIFGIDLKRKRKKKKLTNLW